MPNQVLVLNGYDSKKEKNHYLILHLYRKEAEKCAKVRAYYAACTFVGAALEAILQAFCNVYIDEVSNYYNNLNEKNKKRHSRNILDWKFYQLIDAAIYLGWLPVRINRKGRMKIGDLVKQTQILRNLVHPTVHLREMPIRRLKAKDYKYSYSVVSAAFHYLEVLNGKRFMADLKAQGKI